MAIIVPTLSYRQQVALLRQYEPWRSLAPLVLGWLLFASVPMFAIGGFIAGAYLAGDLHRPIRVLGGALIAVGLGWLSAYIWARKPWLKLVGRRLSWWSVQTPDEDSTAWVLLPQKDWHRGLRVLRRAKVFAPPGATRMASPPEDAPELCMSVLVSRPPALLKDGNLGAAAQARAALARAGIRARVASADVEPDEHGRSPSHEPRRTAA